MRSSFLLPLFTLFAVTAAHSTHQRRAPTLDDLIREDVRAREHVVRATNCELEIREHLAMRMKRRADIRKREAEAAGRPNVFARATSPHFSSFQNTTCLTAPEVTEGPYYVNNAFVRQDIRESQTGVQLLMDFGVMDTSTCTPMNHTFVEIWHANSTGEYGGYSTNDYDHSETFLRGGWYTDSNGMVEVTTVYPGYYNGRTTHVHLMVHKDWTQSENGTLVSHSGNLIHVGQTFFNDSSNDEVYKTSSYTSNKNSRTANSEDTILATATKNGYSAYTSLEYLNGKDISGGLVGYLTLGVDTTSTYQITNKNYNDKTNSNSTSSGNSNSTSSGNSSGSSSGNSTSSSGSDSSAADPQWKGWENTLCLSLFMVAFLGYRKL